MKKLFTIIFLSVTIFRVNADEPVQPFGTTSFCPWASGGNASNDHQDGNMFDISALTEITLNGFTARPTGGTASYEIYYKVGSFVGYESNPSAWTLVGGISNVYVSLPNIFFIPFTVNITIPAGQTYGLYVTSTNNAVQLYNTIGSQTGSNFSTTYDLELKEGVSLSYPFGTVVQNRVFEGGIQYCQGPLSTNNLENKLIAASVFPNPITGKAKVSFDYSSVHGEVTLEAFSLLGEKISLPQSLQGDGIVIDTQSLSSGIYRFMIVDEKKKLIGTGKFSVL